MTGTWCTAELQKAVEKGYRVLKIHEVWHFPEDQQKEGLFTPYVNTLLKYKTEASDWPSHCDTEEKKDESVSDFQAREGIKLDNVAKTQDENSCRNLY